jgi:hypothetical protein
MKLGAIKNVVGGILVGLHLLATFLCFYWLRSRLNASDFRLTILILCPVTAVYALAYLREVARSMFVDAPDVDDARLVRPRFAVLSTLFSLAFCIAIIFTIWDFKGGTTMSPEDLKDQLALIETALGGFLGLIVETLFGKAPPAPARTA